MNTFSLAAPIVALALLSGCAVTREQQLARKAEKVESSLKTEQRRLLALDAAAAERQWRLEHLSSLRYTLSAANVARGAVPYIVEEPQRPMAWDVLDEVYGTIDWNIPLGPGDPKRPLPSQFSGGKLNLTPATPRKDR